MKTNPVPSRRSWLIAIACLLGLLLSGCGMSTVSSRSQERSTAFNGATPAQKQLMKEGWIDSGFTTDMVYIALGQPDKVVASNDPDTVVWVYMNFSSVPLSASLGKGKVTATQTFSGSSTGVAAGIGGPDAKGKITDVRNRVDFSVAPDVGSADPAEEIPRLYVEFYKGQAVNLKLRKF